MLRSLGCAMAVALLTAGTANAAAGGTAGPRPHGGPVRVRIGLAGRDPVGLEAFARAVSTPGDAQYGHYLTPAEARARFGPSDAQVKAVRQWLTESGMHVTGQDAHWIDASGNAGAVRAAFSSGLRTPAVPGDVAGAVANVAQIGQTQVRGMREGATAAILARRGLTGHPIGTSTLGFSGGGDGSPVNSDGGTAIGDDLPEHPDVVHSVGATSQTAVTRSQAADNGSQTHDRGSQTPAEGSQASAERSQTSASPSQTPGTAPQTSKARPRSRDAQSACAPTWGALTADPTLPPGYSNPEPLDVCAYVPTQLRHAYGVDASGLTGSGVTVAVVDAYGSATMLGDANRFAQHHGDRPFGAGQYKETVTTNQWTHTTDGVCQTPGDWAAEEALDVETVHGMAPGATVHYFGSNSCADEDINATLAKIVDTRGADIVSSSFGETMHRTSGSIDPALISQATQLFQYAAAEGIGFYFATGDCGDDSVRTGPGCDPQSARAQTEWPVSSPWVTGVGGTALALGAGAKPLWQAAMGDRRSALSDDGKSWTPFPGDFYFGGGGGTSEDFQQPAYQKGVVPDALARRLGTGTKAAAPMRTLPDVAMDGDLLTAVQVGLTDPATRQYSELPIGGTSAAAPMFAAAQADGQQARVAAGGKPIGFADPDVYRRATSATFTDVVARPAGAPADISTVLDLGPDQQGKRQVRLFELGHDQGLAAGPGYDAATGLGSPREEYLNSFKH